jgi:hypothetical protein
MQYDAILEVCFKTPLENGRKSPVTGVVYSCPLLIDGDAFDCRLYLETRTLHPGTTYVVGAKFLNPDLAVPRLYSGKQITLWEGKEVATGRVVRVGP